MRGPWVGGSQWGLVGEAQSAACRPGERSRQRPGAGPGASRRVAGSWLFPPACSPSRARRAPVNNRPLGSLSVGHRIEARFLFFVVKYTLRAIPHLNRV